MPLEKAKSSEIPAGYMQTTKTARQWYANPVGEVRQPLNPCHVSWSFLVRLRYKTAESRVLSSHPEGEGDIEQRRSPPKKGHLQHKACYFCHARTQIRPQGRPKTKRDMFVSCLPHQEPHLTQCFSGK